MLIALTIIITCTNIGAALLWYFENLRRIKAENKIFRHINELESMVKDDLEAKVKAIRFSRFLLKRSKFHRWLIDGAIKRLDEQERNFANFGEFISILGESIPMKKSDDTDLHKKRIRNLQKRFLNVK